MSAFLKRSLPQTKNQIIRVNDNRNSKIKKTLFSGFIAGLILFIFSYGGFFFAVRFFPAHLSNTITRYLIQTEAGTFFITRMTLSSVLFYHGFWIAFKSLYHGVLLWKLEFRLVYALVELLPVMWIAFSALDITTTMVVSWFVYGLAHPYWQIMFAKIND